MNEKIELELCRKNLSGDPTVVEVFFATREEADKEINTPRPNGLFVRKARDLTGHFPEDRGADN